MCGARPYKQFLDWIGCGVTSKQVDAMFLNPIENMGKVDVCATNPLAFRSPSVALLSSPIRPAGRSNSTSPIGSSSARSIARQIKKGIEIEIHRIYLLVLQASIPSVPF